MSSLSITIEGEKVRLRGQLVIETVPNAEKELASLANKTHSLSAVSISFEQIDKVDTAGLAWLLNLASTLRKADVKVKIEHPPEALLKLSRLSNAEALVFGQQTQD